MRNEIEKFEFERNIKWNGLNILGIVMFVILGLSFLFNFIFDTVSSNTFIGILIISIIIWYIWTWSLYKIENNWNKKLERIKHNPEKLKNYKEGYIYTNSEIIHIFYLLSDLISDIMGGILIAIGVILGLLIASNIISGIPPMVIIGGLLVAILVQVSKNKK